MRAIKEARKYIERKPENDDAKTLSRLVLALESEIDFPITDLYKLDIARFKLALEILDEWRLDRHYASKARLFDVSMQMAVLGQPGAKGKAGKQDKAESEKDKGGDKDDKSK
ncbi:MAG: hypothetical protein Q4G70_11935 [Pseudomonadota bacterium]|nr:hypothetical protein [Pseudomonadota bacterium]